MIDRGKVLLLGVTRKTDNYGVRVLLSGAVDSLLAAEAGLKVALLDYGKEPTRWQEKVKTGEHEIELVNLRFSWRAYLPNNIAKLLLFVLFTRWLPRAGRERLWARNRWLVAILEARTCYSVAGGDSFSDIYALRRFLYVALPQILVLLMGKPLVLLPQTYGPFKGRIARIVARYILTRAQTVFSRDDEGVSAVAELCGPNGPRVHVIPDLGFGMSAQPLKPEVSAAVEALRAKGPIVGLNVSSLLYMGGYDGRNMFNLREAFPEMIDSVVEHIVRKLDAQVLLIPHVCGGPQSQEDETRLCKKLQDRYRALYGDRVAYLDFALDHREIKSLIRRCDIFSGGRMHACIGAVSQAVPTVCQAYSKKFAGVMRPLGDGARVVELRTSTASEVCLALTEVFENREILAAELAGNLEKLMEQQRALFRRYFENTEFTTLPRSPQMSAPAPV